MKFAHKFGVGSRMKTYFPKFFSLPLKNLAEENLEFLRTAISWKHILWNNSTYRQTNSIYCIYDKCTERCYQTWGHHIVGFWCNLWRKLMEIWLCKL